jgi:DUF1680 family protein
MGNTATLKVGGKNITLKQETAYPQNGDVKLTMEKGSGEFTLKIRIPGWVRDEVVPSDLYSYVDGKKLNYTIKVNGQLSPVTSQLSPEGYAVIDRKWKKGDVIDIHFDMEPRLVKANDKVEADRNRLAVERGPLVYCAEWPDNSADVSTYLLNARPQLAMGQKITIFPGHDVQSIVTDAQVLSIGDDGKLKTADSKLTLIPDYAWDHRGQKGGMDVWLPAAVQAASATHVTTSKQKDNGFFK